MNPNQRFSIKEPNVIQEIIDGEAIIADLGNGFYFSLDDTGTQVWAAMVGGASVNDIIDACAASFSGEREDMAEGIVNLLKHLQDEELIVPRDGEPNTGGADLASVITASGGAFVTPVLSKYTDMEQLLLLDPIHDVDETGWPNEPDENEKG